MKKLNSVLCLSFLFSFGSMVCAADALTDASTIVREEGGHSLILNALLENESGNAVVSVSPETMLSLSSLLGFFTDETKVVKNLGKAKAKEINLFLDFKHDPFKEEVGEVVALFDSFRGKSVSSCWELRLCPINFDSLVHSELTPVLRAMVGSVFASHLNIRFLTPDNPYEVYVLTKLREEFLTEESKVTTLDLEGNILSDKGWEQVALLAESRKPFYKMRLTGMHIPSKFVRRLGALRTQVISMAGCGESASALMEMAQGLLVGESILQGIDLRGNEITPDIVGFFANNGFGTYFEDKEPFGAIFVKSELGDSKLFEGVSLIPIVFVGN